MKNVTTTTPVPAPMRSLTDAFSIATQTTSAPEAALVVAKSLATLHPGMEHALLSLQPVALANATT
tara:strand:- start:501 stop:698 length:198 start_codon:yes stop_codon:yes gene_type:complete